MRSSRVGAVGGVGGGVVVVAFGVVCVWTPVGRAQEANLSRCIRYCCLCYLPHPGTSTVSPAGSYGPLLGGWKSFWRGGTHRVAPHSVASIWVGDRSARPIHGRTRPSEVFWMGRAKTLLPGVRLVRRPRLRCPSPHKPPQTDLHLSDRRWWEEEVGDHGGLWGGCSCQVRLLQNSPPLANSGVFVDSPLGPYLDRAEEGYCCCP